VRKTAPLTSTGERIVPSDQKHEFLQWAGTEMPIAPRGLYRGRVTLIVPGELEARRYFFAVPSQHVNLGRTALEIIDQANFSFVEEWENEAASN
jgi:hypothetical protein